MVYLCLKLGYFVQRYAGVEGLWCFDLGDSHVLGFHFPKHLVWDHGDMTLWDSMDPRQEGEVTTSGWDKVDECTEIDGVTTNIVNKIKNNF